MFRVIVPNYVIAVFVVVMSPVEDRVFALFLNTKDPR